MREQFEIGQKVWVLVDERSAWHQAKITDKAHVVDEPGTYSYQVEFVRQMADGLGEQYIKGVGEYEARVHILSEEAMQRKTRLIVDLAQKLNAQAHAERQEEKDPIPQFIKL